VAARETAAAGVPAAPERALEHVRRAQRDAEEMVAAARAQVAVADDNYRTAHEAAIVAGWSAATLTGMGYPPARSAGAGSQRKRTAASRSAFSLSARTARGRPSHRYVEDSARRRRGRARRDGCGLTAAGLR